MVKRARAYHCLLAPLTSARFDAAHIDTLIIFPKRRSGLASFIARAPHAFIARCASNFISARQKRARLFQYYVAAGYAGKAVGATGRIYDDDYQAGCWRAAAAFPLYRGYYLHADISI